MEQIHPMARLSFLLLAVALGPVLHAQKLDRDIRKGNAAYEKGDTKAAIQSYSKAATDERGRFNLGNAYYRQDSFPASQQAFENAAAMAKGNAAQARAYHNLGNAWMKQGKYEEAVNAYKEALKRIPTDNDTRYNLAYAQKKLEQKKQQGKNPDNKDRNKQGQNKQDQQQQGRNDKDRKDEQDQQQPQDQQRKDQDKQQQQPQQDRIDPQDAKRMLDAAEQAEKGVQDKVREKLHTGKPKPPTGKDW
jgi:tetratricopeptide (TPR) repeat protein